MAYRLRPSNQETTYRIIQSGNMITILISPASPDHMAISLRVCSNLHEEYNNFDCRCHTCYDWTKDPSISSNTGSSDRSTASHEAYEHQWNYWTANNSPHGTPDSHASTIVTHATWNSNDPLPDDGAVNVVKVNSIHHRKDLCILDSGANRIVFNNESWLGNTNSIPLTPTNATIYGISGNVKASWFYANHHQEIHQF